MSRPFRLAAAATVLATAVATLAACSSSGTGSTGSSGSSSGSGAPFKVGLIDSFSGPLAPFTSPQLTGWDAALDYYTKGTDVVAGHKIEVTQGDDTGSPSVGSSLATSMIANGAQMIALTIDSSVAPQIAQIAVENHVLFMPSAASTSLVGMSPYVFPSAGASPAGNKLIPALMGSDLKGKTIVDVEQNYAYGQSAIAATKALLQPLGVKVIPLLLPEDTTDFTAAALQIKNDHPDFITSGWSAGPGQTALFNTLSTQGLLTSAKYVGLLSTTLEWAGTGAAFGNSVGTIEFGSGYYDGVSGNAEATALHAYATAHKMSIDKSTMDGWDSAAALVHAIQVAGVSSTSKMAAAIAGYQFTNPSGQVEWRAADHLFLQPLYGIHLKQTDGNWSAGLVQTYPAAQLTPPVVTAISS